MILVQFYRKYLHCHKKIRTDLFYVRCPLSRIVMKCICLFCVKNKKNLLCISFFLVNFYHSLGFFSGLSSLINSLKKLKICIFYWFDYFFTLTPNFDVFLFLCLDFIIAKTRVIVQTVMSTSLWRKRGQMSIFYVKYWLIRLSIEQALTHETK